MKYMSSDKMSTGLLTLDSSLRQIREIQTFHLYIKSLSDQQTCDVMQWIMCNIL